MPVVVGQALDWRTPLLFEQLRYVEFRPYWNVPRSILTGEIVPMLEWNPGYLRLHEMELVNRRGRVLGDSVTPAILRRLRRGELRVRQRPGRHNALGLVKFIFPNGQNVYLHDTPRKELFEESERDFSHGCINVADAPTLAAWVLRDLPEWTKDTVEAALAGSRTRRVLLREPMPVLVFYTTAVARGDGSVWFYPDIYRHDRELLDALKGRRDDRPATSTH
jgi:murein L,D-transpeptidase YcbB/YkuD